MASLASINIKFTADLASLSSSMQTASREIKKAGDQLKGIGQNLSLYVTAPIVAAGGAAIKFATDYEESLNKVNVAFGSSAEKVTSFGDTTLETFGIAKGTALDMAALYGDMATSMGLPQAQAAKMSTSLVGLAGDLASFKNIGIEQATTALNGVFTGETESLKTLGVVMTEANLQQFAYSQGIQGNIKDLSQAEKVQLRYAYVMAQTTNAQGDFARTGGGAANQMRIFQESLKEIGQQFGQYILPYFTKAITLVNEKIKAFGNLDESTKKIILVFAGVAALIGPIILGLGTLISTVGSVITAVRALTLAMASNPFGLIAVAVTTAIVALNLFKPAIDDTSKRLKVLSNETKVMGEVNSQASAMVAKGAKEFKSNIDPLVAIIKSENSSLDVRKKAYNDLIKIAPEFIGTLDDQYRATSRLNEVYSRLLLNLQNKLKAEAKQVVLKKYYDDQAKAIDEVYRAQLEYNKLKKEYLSLSDYDRKYTSEAKDLYAKLTEATNAYRLALENEKIANNNVTQVEKYRQSELEKLIAEQNKYTVNSKEWLAIQEQINALLGKTNDELGNLSNSYKKINETPPIVGSVKYYQEEISRLRKTQEEQRNTRQGYLELQQQIEKFEEKIKNLTAPVISVQEIVSQSSVDKENKSTEDQLKRIAEAKGKELEQRIAWNEKIRQAEIEANERLNKELSESFTSIIEGTVETLAIGFGEIIGQIANGAPVVQSVFGLLMNTIAGLMEQLGKSAIQIGITMSAIKTSFANPATAIAAGIALIAFSQIVKSLIPKDLQGFKDGGIVGGTSYFGDKILARVNSGELILNQKQQARLYDMMQPIGSGPTEISLGLGTRISGSDLEIIIDRAVQKNLRTR